jgi:hypothetical protein
MNGYVTKVFSMAIAPVLSVIQAGLFRGPAVLGALMGASYIGEVAMRGIQKAGEFVYINPPKPESGSWRETAINTIRPYKDLPLKEVLLKGLALSVLGALGFYLAGLIFGPAPAIYNTVLSVLGPIRISNEVHPFIGAVTSWITG